MCLIMTRLIRKWNFITQVIKFSTLYLLHTLFDRAKLGQFVSQLALEWEWTISKIYIHILLELDKFHHEIISKRCYSMIPMFWFMIKIVAWLKYQYFNLSTDHMRGMCCMPGGFCMTSHDWTAFTSSIIIWSATVC